MRHGLACLEGLGNSHDLFRSRLLDVCTEIHDISFTKNRALRSGRLPTSSPSQTVGVDSTRPTTTVPHHYGSTSTTDTASPYGLLASHGKRVVSRTSSASCVLFTIHLLQWAISIFANSIFSPYLARAYKRKPFSRLTHAWKGSIRQLGLDGVQSCEVVIWWTSTTSNATITSFTPRVEFTPIFTECCC